MLLLVRLVASPRFANCVLTLPSCPLAVPHPTEPGSEKQAVETLFRYLADRRPTLSGALANLGITPSQAHLHPSLSSNSVDSLFDLPDGIPIASLVPDQLLRFAQLVDTALFKSYLVIRPSLVGSLCRIDNWCEVEEVEEELRARQVCFHAPCSQRQLIHGLFCPEIYRLDRFVQRKEDAREGAKVDPRVRDYFRMPSGLELTSVVHGRLSLDEDDVRDKLEPAVRYLQRLGPEYLPLIFENARWVLDVDRTIGLQVRRSTGTCWYVSN